MMKTTETLKAVLSLSQDLKERFSLYGLPTEEDYARLVDIAAMAKTCAGHFSDDGKPGAGLFEQDDGRLAVAAGSGVVSSPENGLTLNIDEESPLYFDDDGGLAINPTQKLSVEFFQGLTPEERMRLFHWFDYADTMKLSENQLPLESFTGKINLGHSLCFSRNGRLFVSSVGARSPSIVFSENNRIWSELYQPETTNRGAPSSPLTCNGVGDLYVRGFDIHPNQDGSIGICKENDTAWSWQYLLGPADTGWNFAHDIALSNNNLLAVGAPLWGGDNTNYGAVLLVSELLTISDPVILPEQFKLLSLSSPEEGDGFGSSVALNSDGTILVGSAPGRKNNAGEVTIYMRHGEQWVPYPPLVPDIADGQFGTSLSLNAAGDKLAVGSPGEEGNRGAVYVYRRCHSSWELVTKLTGDAIATERFGFRVALSDDGGTLAVSSPVGKNKNGIVTGAAWWFGEDLQLRQRLLAEDGMENDHFGQSIALGRGGNLLAIGAPGAAGTGKVYIYE